MLNWKKKFELFPRGMMSEFRADLHCHSTCSDGTFAPEVLVRYAKEIGLSGLSITDHDTVQAYAKALPCADKIGLEMISGVEFSSMMNNASIHLLGYAFKLDSPSIAALCERHVHRRKNRNLAILERLAKHKMPVAEEDLLIQPSSEMSSIGRVHIAHAMVKKGYVETPQEAFNKYIAEGQSCYDPGEGIGVQETIDCIHQAGGKAVIAHPHLVYDKQILQKLFQLDFDGIEVYYGRFLRTQVGQWAEIAKQKGWIMTGGSDFHGENRPQASLGSSWANEEVFKSLRAHFLSHYL